MKIAEIARMMAIMTVTRLSPEGAAYVQSKADYEVLIHKTAFTCRLDVQTAQSRLESLCALLSCSPNEAFRAILRGGAEYAYMQCGEWVPVMQREAQLPESFIFGVSERMPEPSPYERGYLDRFQDRRRHRK